MDGAPRGERYLLGGRRADDAAARVHVCVCVTGTGAARRYTSQSQRGGTHSTSTSQYYLGILLVQYMYTVL